MFSKYGSYIGAQLKGTNNKVKSYIPEDLRATSSAFIVELCGLNGEGVVNISDANMIKRVIAGVVTI